MLKRVGETTKSFTPPSLRFATTSDYNKLIYPLPPCRGAAGCCHVLQCRETRLLDREDYFHFYLLLVSFMYKIWKIIFSVPTKLTVVFLLCLFPSVECRFYIKYKKQYTMNQLLKWKVKFIIPEPQNRLLWLYKFTSYSLVWALTLDLWPFPSDLFANKSPQKELKTK